MDPRIIRQTQSSGERHLLNTDRMFSPAMNVGVHTRRPHNCRNSTAADRPSISKSQPKSSSKRIRSSIYTLTTGSFPEQGAKQITDKRYSEPISVSGNSGKTPGVILRENRKHGPSTFSKSLHHVGSAGTNSAMSNLLSYHGIMIRNNRFFLLLDDVAIFPLFFRQLQTRQTENIKIMKLK